MKAELNLMKLTPLQGRAPSKDVSASSPLQGRPQEEEKEFASVLNQVSSEQKPQNSQSSAEENPAPSPENGLAAGNEKTLDGEEGSSRSASLSPKEPDKVEDAAVPVEAQVLLSGQVESLVQNPGGELPFLVQELPQVDVEPALDPEVEVSVVAPALPQVKAAQSAVDALENLASPPQPEPLIEELFVDPQLAGSASQAQEKPVVLPQGPEVSNKVQRPVAEPIAQAPVPEAQAAPEKEPVFSDLLQQEKPQADAEPAPQEPKSAPAAKDISVAKPGKDGIRRIPTRQAEEPVEEIVAPQPKAESPSLEKLDAHFVEGLHRESAGQAADSAKEKGPDISSDGNGAFLQELSGLSRVKESPKASESEASAPARVLPGSLEDQVLRQIKIKLQPGLSQVQISLNPPELGSVRIRFEMQGDRMKARIEARESVTAALLERHLPELRQAMSQAGIEVKEIEVLTGHQAAGFSFAQPQQSEEQQRSRRDAGQSRRNSRGDADLVGAGVGERRISRAGGGIDYFV